MTADETSEVALSLSIVVGVIVVYFRNHVSKTMLYVRDQRTEV